MRRVSDVVSVALVREVFDALGLVAPEVWLDFHARFAGRIQGCAPHGGDAVLGIVHRSPRHLPTVARSLSRGARLLAGLGLKGPASDVLALGFDWEAAAPGDPDGMVVACADAHPSFDYRLTATGRFLGNGSSGPAASFDVRFERDALYNHALDEALRSRATRTVDHDEYARLSSRLAEFRVAEASDEFVEAFLTPAAFVALSPDPWTVDVFTRRPLSAAEQSAWAETNVLVDGA